MAEGGTTVLRNGGSDSDFDTLTTNQKYGSVRSTKSLSVFLNQDAPMTLRRSEEVTIDMYAHGPDIPSTVIKTSRKRIGQQQSGEQKPSRENKSSKQQKFKNISTNKVTEQECQHHILSSPVDKKGLFQMKSATSPNTVVKMESPSLRDAEFRSNLEASLNKQTTVKQTENRQITTDIESRETTASKLSDVEQLKSDIMLSRNISLNDQAVGTALGSETRTSVIGKILHSSSASHADSHYQQHQQSSNENLNSKTVTELNIESTAIVTTDINQASRVIKAIRTDDSNNNKVSADSTGEIGSITNTQEVGNSLRSGSKTAMDRVSKTALIVDSSQEQQLRSPPDIDTSTNSAIRNKAIKAKFESMLSRSEDVPSSPGSSVRSPTKTYLRRTGSTTVTGDRSDVYRKNSLSSVGDGEKLITSATVNRMEEVQSLIREGTVSRLSRQLSSGIPSHNSSPALERRQVGNTESLTDEEMTLQFTEYRHLTTGDVSISHDELELNTTSSKDAFTEKMNHQPSALQNSSSAHALTQSGDEQLLKEARFMLRQRRDDNKQKSLQHLSDDDSDAWPTTASERIRQHQLHRIQRSSPELSDFDASRQDSFKQQEVSQLTRDMLTMTSSAVVQPYECSQRFDGTITNSSAYEMGTETVGNHDTDAVVDDNVTERKEKTEKQQQQEQKYTESETRMTLAAEHHRQSRGDELTSQIACSSPPQLSKQPLITTQRDEIIDICWTAPDSGTDEHDGHTPDLEIMVDQPINLEWKASRSIQSLDNTSKRDYNNTSRKQEQEHRQQHNVVAAEKRGPSGSRSDIAHDEVDGTASRSHIKSRDVHYPQRVHSIASSDITPSIESLSSNDRSSPVDALRRPVRQYSQSSSDATLTDNERAPPYRGRRLQTTGREHMRRVTQPPDDRPLKLSAVHLTDSTTKIGTDEKRLTPVRLYAGRGPTPVSGRQKIRRSTESTGDDWEISDIHQYTKSRQATNERSITPTYDSYTSMPLDDEIRTSSFGDRHVYGPKHNTLGSYPRSRQSGNIEIKVVNSSEAEPIYRDRRMMSSGTENFRRTAALPLRTEFVPTNHRRHLHHSMPDLQDPGDNSENGMEESRIKHMFVDETPLRYSSVNYSSDYGKHGNFRPVHTSRNRRRRTVELPGQLTTSVVDLPTQFVDRHNEEHEHHKQSTQKQQQQQQQPVVRIINHPEAQLNRISRSGSTADVIGRKRGYIMRATVENAGYPTGRKHWRLDNMAATDIEDMDLDDNIGHRRLARRHRSFVAKVRVGDDECDFESDDALSVFSEPAFVLHHSRAPPKQLNSGSTTPLIEYLPLSASTAMYSLAHVDTRINNILSPTACQTETIESVDPELKDASKKGTNYHITLTLKPVINNRPASRAQMTEIKRSLSDATQFRIQTPVTQTPSLSTSRIETSGYTQQLSPSVHLRGISRSGSRAGVLRTHSRIDTASDEIVVEPINSNIGSSGHSPRPPNSQRQSLGQIAFDVEVHSDDELLDNFQLTSSIHTVDAPQYKLPLSSSLEIKYDPNESLRQIPKNPLDSGFKLRVNEVNGKEEQLPTIKRRSFLISNAIDTTKDAKINDVTNAQFDDDDDDDRDDSDDDLNHNTNLFDSLYFQTKENPLYSSDQEFERDAENDEVIVRKQKSEHETRMNQQSTDQHNGSAHSRVASVQTHRARHVDQGNQTDRPRTKETAVQPNASLQQTAVSATKMITEKRRYLDDADEDVTDGAFNNMVKSRVNKQRSAPKRDAESLPGDEIVNGSHHLNKEYSKPYESYSPPPNDSHDESLTKRSSQYTKQSLDNTGRDDDDISASIRHYASKSGEQVLVNYDGTEDFDFGFTDVNEANYFKSTSNSNRLPQAALQVQEMFEDGDFDQEVTVSREFGKKSRESGMRWDREKAASSRHSARTHPLSVSETIARLDVRSLMVNAPSTSVRQTIDVERLEDEILMGPQPNKQHMKPDLSDAGIADYDTVSEQVAMKILDNGLAVMTARVRCERTVPIRGSDDMFKKSSVIVTKCIEVDLTVTPQRLRLLKTIKGVSTSLSEDASASSAPLNQSDILVLYKTFITLAEMNKANRITK